jgi:hypothetical protein
MRQEMPRCSRLPAERTHAAACLRIMPDQIRQRHGALEKVGALFPVQREINGQSPDIHLTCHPPGTQCDAARGAHDLPRNNLNRISKKGDLATAFRYCLKRWTALTCDTLDGRLEMSNNDAETGLSLGSDTSGVRAAVFYTIIPSAKLNGINPEPILPASSSASATIPRRISTNCCRGTGPRSLDQGRDQPRTIVERSSLD